MSDLQPVDPASVDRASYIRPQRRVTPPRQMPPRPLLPGMQFLPKPEVLQVYLMLIGLMVVTAGLGLKGVSLARPIFILGCAVVAWRAWRINPGLHIEVVISLLAFAPLMRRIVDMRVGYDEKGIMLIGPMLALCIALTELRSLLTKRQANFGVYLPYGIMVVCLMYGWSITSFSGDFVPAGIDTAKSLIPMFYAVYLIQRGDDCEEIIQGAARAFLIISPIMGVYGVLQWINPPEWDRYWMIYSQMKSIGNPEPRQVRVFSTMNAPGSFAVFAACGLLLFGFCRRGILPLLVIIPITIALLLTTIRTAWIICAITMAYCFFFNATRSRATLLTLCLLVAGAAAVLMTPFGEIIGDRLATMGDPAQDGSGHERLQQYVHIYSSMDQYMFGTGVGSRVKDLKLKNADGQFIASAVTMGIFVGNIYVLALIWAGVQGLMKTQTNETPLRLVAAGAVISYLCVLPLLTVSSGEISFLYWLFVGVLPTTRVAPSHPHRPHGVNFYQLRRKPVSGLLPEKPY